MGSVARLRPNRGSTANPRKPLTVTSREHFSQLVAKGVKARDAYVQCGYKGNDAARYALRASKDIDARISYLLEKQIEDDTKLRQKREPHPKHSPDLQARIRAELANIAFARVTDHTEWKRIPILDEEGNPTGRFTTDVVSRPSERIDDDALAAIGKVHMVRGDMKIEGMSKLEALDKLAKIEGMYAADAPIVTTQTTVNQVNIGEVNALEAVRRLAFALEKARQSQLIDVTPAISHAPKTDAVE